jgi:predicted DNA-binding ribbon-helix-helix protein
MVASSFKIQEALARREAGEPLVEIGRSYNVSHSTISLAEPHTAETMRPLVLIDRGLFTAAMFARITATFDSRLVAKLTGPTAMQSRSVAFGGRKTSLRVEDQFWTALREIARRRHMRLGELIGTIDANRKEGTNLSSAIRLFVFEAYQVEITPPQKPKGPPLAFAS